MRCFIDIYLPGSHSKYDAATGTGKGNQREGVKDGTKTKPDEVGEEGTNVRCD
jgi:hypothetical protein